MRDGGGPIRAPWSSAAAGFEGDRERGPRETDSPPHLERRRRVVAWPRQPVAAAEVVRDGGAAAGERG